MSDNVNVMYTASTVTLSMSEVGYIILQSKISIFIIWVHNKLNIAELQLPGKWNLYTLCELKKKEKDNWM